MKLTQTTKKILRVCCQGIAMPALKSAIMNDLFKQAKFGAPLKESTIKKKRKGGRIFPDKPLFELGRLMNELKFTISGTTAKLFSTGKSKAIQTALYQGNSNMQPRGLFNKDLPAKGGTIETACVKYAKNEITRVTRKEISKACERFNESSKSK